MSPFLTFFDGFFSRTPHRELFVRLTHPSCLIPLGALQLEVLKALGYPDDDQIDTT